MSLTCTTTIPAFVATHPLSARYARAPPRRPRARPTLPLALPRPPRARLMIAPARWTCAASRPNGGAAEAPKPASVSQSLLSPPSPGSGNPMRRRTRLLWALGLLGSGVLLGLLFRSGGVTGAMSRAEAFIRSVGVLRGCLALFLLNFCTVLFCFPANMGLMLASGAVLGAGPAFLALHASKTLAACVAFLLARGALAPRVERALAARPRVAAALDAAGANAGWRFVLLMRLSPFPGFLLNYALSLTKVSFWQYAIATAIGVVPSIANLCLLGAAARDVGAAAAGVAVPMSWLATTVRFVCMGSMLVVSVLATRNARAAFAALKADDSPQPDEEMGISGASVESAMGGAPDLYASQR